MSKQVMEVLELPVRYTGKVARFRVWLSWLENLARRLN